MPDINVNKLSEALNTKADIDLNNTGVFSTSEGGVVNLASSTPANASGKEVTSADFFQSNLLNYTTNRILEIPQDIKLELNNGSLVRKAGSKFYIPNGFETDGITPKFDVIISDSDISCPVSGQNYPHLVQFLNPQNIADFPRVDLISCFSGTTAPSGYTQMVWYDISNNIMKLTTNGGSTWYSGYSLPYAITTETASGGYISIDQVFNGFGYIGSTVFALPGVKVQTPNGKNADGTYKSVIRTVDSVRTYNAGAWGTRNLYISFSGDVNSILFEALATDCFTYNKQFASAHITFSYDENTGRWWYSINQSPWEKNSVNIVGSCRVESGRITSFEPYTVDSVLNSSLSNLSAAGQAKFDAKANVSNTVTTDTAQTISGVKTFTGGTLKALRPILLKQDNANEGGQIDFERSNNSVLKNNPYIDLLINTIRFVGTNSNNTVNTTLQVDLQNNQVWIPTPALTANDYQAATTAWVNSKMQVVSALPANPDPNVFYFIPG